MTWMTCVASNLILASPLALTAWGLQRFARQHALARMLWIIVLAKLVTPPLILVSFNELPINPTCRNGTCGCPQHKLSAAWNSFSVGLLAVWGVGTATTGWTAWRRWSHFEKLLSHATPVPADWRAAAEQLSAELGIVRCPRVLAVPGSLPPMVVPGWGHLRLLVPLELVSRLGESQRSVLLLHELTHIRRRDHWVRFLELAVRIVYWWLPVVAVVSRQIRSCEEICCDASVVEHRPQARRDYAGLLLDVIDFVSPQPHPVEHATGMNTIDDLEHRLRTILHGASENRRRWPIGLLTALLTLGVTPWGVAYDWNRLPVAAAAIRDAEEPALKSVGSEACEPGESREPSLVFSACCPS